MMWKFLSNAQKSRHVHKTLDLAKLLNDEIPFSGKKLWNYSKSVYLSYDWSVKEKFYEVTSEILLFNFVLNSTKGFALQSGLTLDGT